MSIAAFAVRKRAVTYFATALVIIAGVVAFGNLGQLEDPEFTIKTVSIVTSYPGASPEEVELEVTDRIETKIQEMKQLKWIESYSRAGVSYIKAEMLPFYWGEELQPVFEQLRRKIREVETELPPGAGRPQVNDDFGDVFGFQLAITGDGFNYAELEKFAKALRKELSLVDGVARVDLWGVQSKVIYLETRQTQLSQIGLSDSSIVSTLANQNAVVDAGSLYLQDKRFRIAPTGAFRSPEDIANLVVRPSALDTFQNDQVRAGVTGGDEFIRIRDFADVKRGYRDPPLQVMRLSDRRAVDTEPVPCSFGLFGLCLIQGDDSGREVGAPRLNQAAIGLSITNRPGENIVKVGQNIDRRINELEADFPVGIDVHRVHWQGDLVDASVQSFLINFAEAVAIVLLILTIAMGWRMGIIIGTALIITVLGTFLFMSLFQIDLHRMSLGALVISLGMMVDNAIVVADGMAVRLQRGMDRTRAAVEAASQPAIPLLGATIIAVMAFYPIAGSPESTGEYCLALFQVVAISLLFSWLVSLTVTPLQCIDMLPAPKGDGGDPYGGRFFTIFRGFVVRMIRGRWLFLASMVGLLAVSMVGFGQVKQLFFPASSMAKFMIDFYAPEGTRIQDVSDALRETEARIMEDPRVENVATYLGSGPPRFYLPVEPEEPNQAYGQLVVNVRNYREIPEVIDTLKPWFAEAFPDALVPIRMFGVGPAKTWKLELRVSGPAVADAAELRRIAEEFQAAVDAHPLTDYSRIDWMQRVQRVEPDFNTERAQRSGVTRDDVASATKRAYDGRDVGLYREGDDLIPIVLRYVEEERREVSNLPGLQVRPSVSVETLPLAQVANSIGTEWEDPIIRRRDRRRMAKVQANPIPSGTVPMMAPALEQAFNAIELPPGYKWEWGGEWEDTQDSTAALIPGIVPAAAIVMFIIVYLYNAFRPLIVILLTVPLVMIGVTAGLLVFDVPFGFMSLLGAMSLAGMMIKNIIVLLDEAEQQLAEGLDRYQAIMMAAVSRLRPVLLAAGTTVLGVIPLLSDVFWVGMAVAIMSGLTVGSFLTMVVVPVLYCTLYRLSPPKASASGDASAAGKAPATA